MIDITEKNLIGNRHRLKKVRFDVGYITPSEAATIKAAKLKMGGEKPATNRALVVNLCQKYLNG